MQGFINKIWYQEHPLRWLLYPLSLLFGLVSWFRRVAFRWGWKTQHRVAVPVIVVGNITAGGSGKTPTVIYLIELLRRNGYRPGVISRGYGARFEGTRWVAPGAEPAEVGDEPAMIVARTCVPMVVGANRLDAANRLLREADVDVIICDDGLQHYRLHRDIELAIVDGERRLGNGLLLPAGPLREGGWRLQTVDFVIINGGAASAGEEQMHLRPAKLQPVCDNAPETVAPEPGDDIVAMAAIGNPGRFFSLLSHLGYKLVKTREFTDHQAFEAHELLALAGEFPLLMTEKDAVKCREFAQQNWWYLAVDAKLTTSFDERLLTRLAEAARAKEGRNDGI
jgi:tetraacyldisaccharide 4'-kinase